MGFGTENLIFGANIKAASTHLFPSPVCCMQLKAPFSRRQTVNTHLCSMFSAPVTKRVDWSKGVESNWGVCFKGEPL